MAQDKKKLARDAYAKYLGRRRKAFDELEVKPKEEAPEEGVLGIDDAADYFSAGTGFPPDGMGKETLKEQKAIAEIAGGDFDGYLKVSSAKDKVMDAMTIRLKRRQKALDDFKSDHPRAAKGQKVGKSHGGQFVKKGAGGGSGSGEQKKEEPAKTEEPQEEKPPVEEEKKESGIVLKKKEEPYEEQIQRRTPEQIERINKAKAERRERLINTVVGIPSKELTDELNRTAARRKQAKDFWKKIYNFDLDNGTIAKDGGFSPNDVIQKAVDEDKLKGLSMQDKIQMCAEVQRKNLKNVYGESCPVKQNTKQEASLVYGADTIRGCLNNCISCYSCVNCSAINSIKFDTPVECKIGGKSIYTRDDLVKRKADLQKKYDKATPEQTRVVSIMGVHEVQNVRVQLDKDIKHVQGQIKEMDEFKDVGKVKLTNTILRIGVNGDPGTNWTHTNEVMKKKLGKLPVESVVYVSKLQRIEGFDPKVVRNMHISIDPLNREQMDRTMENVKKLKKLDPSLNLVLRIRSFDSNDPELKANLTKAVEFANTNDLPVLETKMRFTPTVAKMMNMNMSSYHPTDGINYKANHNFLSDKAWDVTTKKDVDVPNNPLKVNKHFECDKTGKGCSGCGNCRNTAIQNYTWNKKAEVKKEEPLQKAA